LQSPQASSSARVVIVRVLAALLPVALILSIVQARRWSDWVPGGEIVQLTNSRAFDGLPSLSPDGEWIAYRSDASGNGDILLSRLDGWKTVNLTAGSADDESAPAFSPDGTLIAFGSPQSGIAVVSKDGGAPRRIVREGTSPAWTPDGRFIVYVGETNTSNDFRSGVGEGWKVDVASGETVRLTGGDFHEPAVSPGGLRIAYSGRTVDARNRRRVTSAREHIWTMPLNGGEPRRITSDAAAESSPMWSPDGRFLYYVSTRTGPSAIWRLRVDERTGLVSGAPVIVPTPFTQPVRLTRSADGRRLAWSDAKPIQRAMRIELDADARKTRGAPAELMPGDVNWEAAEPSPDESYVVLSAPTGHLYVARSGDVKARPLTDEQGFDRRARWSPDGRSIAFQSNRSGVYGIWFADREGQALRVLPWTGAGDLLYPVWSPDGQQLAVWDVSISGSRLLRADHEGGPSETLPPMAQGGFIPSDWSPDGKLIAGTVAGNIWFYSLATRSYQQFWPGTNPVWLADSRRLIYAYGGHLYIADGQLKISRELLALPDQQLDGPRLSRDNRHLYFTGSGTDANLWLMKVDGNR
jgi:Tol biopolymer transport system component